MLGQKYSPNHDFILMSDESCGRIHERKTPPKKKKTTNPILYNYLPGHQVITRQINLDHEFATGEMQQKELPTWRIIPVGK